MSFAVADGVGGWSDQTDPALFSQALMYHAHRYGPSSHFILPLKVNSPIAKGAWAGEPESDPLQALDEPVEGWELTPQECLDLAYGGVLREKLVEFGRTYIHSAISPLDDVLGSSTACVIHLNSQNGLLRAAKSVILLLWTDNRLNPCQSWRFRIPNHTRVECFICATSSNSRLQLSTVGHSSFLPFGLG